MSKSLPIMIAKLFGGNVLSEAVTYLGFGRGEGGGKVGRGPTASVTYVARKCDGLFLGPHWGEFPCPTPLYIYMYASVQRFKKS